MADKPFNHFAQLKAKQTAALDQITRKAGFDCQAGYQQRAAVDTGFQVNSCYVVTSNQSTYSQAKAEAETANPKATMLPEVERPQKLEVKCGVGAAYAFWNEIKRIPAMHEAVEAVRPGFFKTCQRLEDMMR